MKRLPLFVSCLILHLAALVAPCRAAVETGGATTPSGFAIHRGTNLSHWLSQDFGWAPKETFITANDVRFIAQSGFDHVRLPVDEKELWDDKGAPIEKHFALLTQGIDSCLENHLRVIVDLHTVRSHHFNAANEGLTNTLWSNPAAQERFIDLWRQLSARLHHYPVSEVAYEIMNEPVADKHEDWNLLIEKSLKALRQLEPNRVVVLGANRWQIPSNLPFLRVPEGDKNLILSFHFYSPMLLTHHLAEWVPIKTYTGPVAYPGPVVSKATYDTLVANPEAGFRDLVIGAGDAWNSERMVQDFAPAIRRAKELGLPLYCGEFGCLGTIPRADRLAYYKDLIHALESNHISWSNWEYKGDFGIFEWHGSRYYGGAPDTELIQILIHTP